MTSPNSPNNGLHDLGSDLDSIYNTYARKSNNQSVDTLDSEINQAEGPADRIISGRNLPAVHISSRLSSLQLGDEENIVRSAPETPNSGDSFDFMSPTHQHRALTNSSLNVLLDTPTTQAEFKSLVDSTEYIDRVPNGDGAPFILVPGNRNRNKTDEEDDEVENEEDWESKGAAVRKVQDATSYKIIRRTVSDFKFGKDLGEGSYSTVVLATDKHTNKKYAVKILDKRHIIKEKKVKYVNIEKHALNRLTERMGIINLYFTFQDKSSLYFVLDYASNGELLGLIKKYNTLNEDCTRHFGAQILDAIKYMHDNGVIHRDIKPENILLDDKLRIQITDFGTARLLEKKNDESEDYPLDVRAKSFVGTAEYVSPELLESKYCGKPGDIWAFGCIIYQMIAGKPPFKATNEYLTFQKITKLQYAFSAGFPTIIRDLIKQILVLQPSKRATIPQIQKHYFFSSIDFNSYDQIWGKEPPEIGPYKMNAKAMMKVPQLTKAASSSVLPTKKVKKNATTGGNTNGTSGEAMPPVNRILSEGNIKNVNPASVAAFVLGKKENNSQTSLSGDTDSPTENEPKSKSTSNGNTNSSSNNTSTTVSRTPSAADYIPGTNILRPTITTRNNYSRSITQKRPPKAKQKSNVMEVTPPSSLEAAWSSYLKHADERVLKIGPVIVHREATDAFEKKHKGSLHQAPLGLSNKLQAMNSSTRSSTSLLSQVVNGSTNGLRGNGVTADDSSDAKDESDAIRDFGVIEETPDSLKRSDSTSTDLNSTGSSKYSKSSLFKKLGFSHTDKGKDHGSSKDDNSSVTPNRVHPLDKSRTCTMIITTHGRALIFFRNDTDVNYRLVSEIKLSHPIISFKELVSSSSKFQKMLPTTGIFAITSSETTLVFEVEKFEVASWTEALAKAKLNQYEREREKEQKEENAANASPKLLDAPIFASIPSNRRSPSAQQEEFKVRQSEIKQSSSAPSTPSIRVVSDTKTSTPNPTPTARETATRSKSRTGKRKPPPPIPSGALNMHTGLPGTDNGMLHAAQLAVSNNANNIPTNNRRSSFSKEDADRYANTAARRTTSGSKPAITSMNSKFLARSQRKK
ncbi:uncharacterized protein RJT20DRAFT_128717 [Scheffersomyces xylosifermentans]|uniref:uncharacterized protein n=1 Tax=Scheffersomyces xylosifermentans TaxID=1304137 RepID=UPI00315CAE11